MYHDDRRIHAPLVCVPQFGSEPAGTRGLLVLDRFLKESR